MNWDQPTVSEKKPGMGLAQVGTAFFIVLTFVVLACYLVIFLNPQVPFNPFPPLVVHLPTATPVAKGAATPTVPPTLTRPRTFPATWTPTHTPTVTPTYTPRPTWTPAPPTSTPKPLPAFSLASDPIYTEQKVYSDVGDWWTGLAGEVFDKQGQPVTDVKIHVWDDYGRHWYPVPGDADKYADVYGAKYGGKGTYAWWEQVLEASCHQSVGAHVQVERNGKPASSVVTVKTTGNCDKNLVIIHFRKNW